MGGIEVNYNVKSGQLPRRVLRVLFVEILNLTILKPHPPYPLSNMQDKLHHEMNLLERGNQLRGGCAPSRYALPLERRGVRYGFWPTPE